MERYCGQYYGLQREIRRVDPPRNDLGVLRTLLAPPAPRDLCRPSPGPPVRSLRLHMRPPLQLASAPRPHHLRLPFLPAQLPRSRVPAPLPGPHGPSRGHCLRDHLPDRLPVPSVLYRRPDRRLFRLGAAHPSLRGGPRHERLLRHAGGALRLRLAHRPRRARLLGLGALTEQVAVRGGWQTARQARTRARRARAPDAASACRRRQRRARTGRYRSTACPPFFGRCARRSSPTQRGLRTSIVVDAGPPALARGRGAPAAASVPLPEPPGPLFRGRRGVRGRGRRPRARVLNVDGGDGPVRRGAFGHSPR